MSEMETRVRDAFDSVHVPQDVKARALAAVEARRAEDLRPGEVRLEVVDGGAPSAPAGKRGRRSGRTGFRLLGAKIAVAACLVFAAIGVGGFALASTPAAYVGIDVNPSVELGINRFDRVVEANAYNQDGQDVLDQAQVEGMPYADALDAIERAMVDQGYLSDDAVIEVNVVCDTDALYSEIESACLSCFSGSGGGAYCSRATSEERQSSASMGMGMGKYRVYESLSEAGVDISAEEASDMTMRELYDLAAAEGVNVEGGCGACMNGTGMGRGQGFGGSESGDGSNAGTGNDSSAGKGNGFGDGSNSSSSGGDANGQGNGSGRGNGNGRGANSGMDQS